MRGDFLLLTQTSHKKQTPWAFHFWNRSRGATRIKKTIGESGGKPSHPHTDQMSDNTTRCFLQQHRSSKGDSAENIETQPIAAEWTPVVQTVGERLNFNFFFFFLFYPYYFLNAAVGPCLLPWKLYILSGLSHTHANHSDRINRIFKLWWNQKFSVLLFFLGYKTRP